MNLVISTSSRTRLRRRARSGRLALAGPEHTDFGTHRAVKCAVVTSTSPDLEASIDGLCDELSAALSGQPVDLLAAFFTPHHTDDAATLRSRLLGRLKPRVLLGGPAESVIGGADEIEGRVGLSLWGAHWPGSQLEPFELTVQERDDEVDLLGWPDEAPPDPGFLVLADPFTTPGDALLEGFAKRWPGAPVVGGMASGHQGSGQAVFLTNEGLQDSGCVGVAIGGSVRLDPVVSQGCRPVGKHYVITKAQQNVILALGGKPALAQLRGAFGEVEARDQQLMQTALHVGRVIDERKSSFERRDLLVRNVLGIDPKNEAIAINDFVRPGQTIQFMVRDAAAAGEDLSTLLTAESKRGPVLGAMLFSCNGRGKRFFGQPNHDIDGLHKGVGDVPTAGFFANGEIGPVGGHPFLHGFTASIALFRERKPAE
jgi:small ligand-binding sensory domain FIST